MTFREALLLKARLLVDGLQIDESALDGVGERYKEQVHHLFEYDFDLHQTRMYPGDLRLPHDLVVQVRLNGRSPLRAARRDGVVVIEEAGQPISTLDWLERPRFYDQRTSSGTPMKSVAELVGEDCLSICHTNFCLLFTDGKPCAFCNLNTTPQAYDEVLIRKRAADVAETAAAAMAEGVMRHITFTGGILAGDKEIRVLETYFEAFRAATGLDHVPGTVVMTPPADLKDLERLHRLGLRGIGFNLECFDPAFFRAFCPGKEARIGYSRYRDALRAAVDIFGAGGRVFSGFMAGLEPMPSLLAGMEELAREGVASIPLVWSPSPGTLLHGHRAPFAEWYLELSEKAAGILVRRMHRRRGETTAEPLRCPRCHGQCLLHDVIQNRVRLLSQVASVA